ncbi:MAG: hypothetical protein R8L07_14670 [Alphaproteobacteria bacterium]|nr:hypothetical protein [Alphaproteobacteria bacterium]
MPDTVVEFDGDHPNPLRLYLARRRAGRPEPADPFAFHDAMRTVETEFYDRKPGTS